MRDNKLVDWNNSKQFASGKKEKETKTDSIVLLHFFFSETLRIEHIWISQFWNQFNVGMDMEQMHWNKFTVETNMVNRSK